MNAMPEAAAPLRMTPALRVRIEATIERLVALLDAIDGDPDLELTGDELDDPWTESCSQGADELAKLPAAARVHATIALWAVSVGVP
jgi:hypothetical protein